MKEQFAGLFQRFLEEQTRIKEISLIKNLEKTAQTLNKLVNFLSDENKGQTEEINRILMTNHPLVESLRNNLNIPYNFYIEGYSDLRQLLDARGFKEIETDPWDDDDFVSEWVNSANRKKINLKISDILFDDDKKLKFLKRTDWKDEYVQFTISEEPNEDDLPF